MGNFLARLRAETHDAHRAAERALPLTSRRLSLDEYRLLLGNLLRWYRPLEALLLESPYLAAHGFAYREREKTPWLTADLAALGAAPESRNDVAAEALPSLASSAATMGCLYVIEGATLGGQVITRLLGERLGLHPAHGARFFSSYGSHVGERWKAVQRLLLETTTECAAEEETIAAAQATFLSFQRCVAPEATLRGQGDRFEPVAF